MSRKESPLHKLEPTGERIDELPGFAKATPWQASFDRQIVELGGCAADSVDYSTVPAPSFVCVYAVAGRALKRGQ